MMDDPGTYVVQLLSQPVLRAPALLLLETPLIHLRAKASKLRFQQIGFRITFRLSTDHRFDVAKRACIDEVGRNRGNDNSRFDSQKIDSRDRHANPRINHDPFVENAIEDVDDAGRRGAAVKQWTTCCQRSALVPASFGPRRPKHHNC